MAGYRDSSAYDFSLFEPQATVAPASKNNSRNRTYKKAAAGNHRAASGDVRRKNNTSVKKTAAGGSAAVRTSENRSIDTFLVSYSRNSKTETVSPAVKKIMAYSLLCFCLITCLLFVNAQSDKVASQIADVKSKIDIAEGETVRLNAELSSKISNEKIESYAENVLGMVKAESYQITYIDLSDGDKVVVSGDKSTESGVSAFPKLKELFANLF